MRLRHEPRGHGLERRIEHRLDAGEDDAPQDQDRQRQADGEGRGDDGAADAGANEIGPDHHLAGAQPIHDRAGAEREGQHGRGLGDRQPRRVRSRHADRQPDRPQTVELAARVR